MSEREKIQKELLEQYIEHQRGREFAKAKMLDEKTLDENDKPVNIVDSFMENEGMDIFSRLENAANEKPDEKVDLSVDEQSKVEKSLDDFKPQDIQLDFDF